MRRGQAFVEYLVLVSAVGLAVMLVARVAHNAFVAHAQKIEAEEMVF